jgi:hypothetical protein
MLLFLSSTSLVCASGVVEYKEPSPTKSVKCADDYLCIPNSDESRLINFLHRGFECELRRAFSLRDFKPNIEISEFDDQLQQSLTQFFKDDPLVLSMDTLLNCRPQVMERCIAALQKFRKEQVTISTQFVDISHRLQRHTLFSADDALFNPHNKSNFRVYTCDHDDLSKTLRNAIIQLIVSPVKEFPDDLTPGVISTSTLGTVLACATALSLNIENDPQKEKIVIQVAQMLIDTIPMVVETEPQFVLNCMDLFLSNKRIIPELSVESWRTFVTTQDKLLLAQNLKPSLKSRVAAALSKASKSAIQKLSPRARIAPNTYTKPSPRSPREGRSDQTSSAPVVDSAKNKDKEEL